MKLSWVSLLAERPNASALVDEAEECTRGARLWPWPGTDQQERR